MQDIGRGLKRLLSRGMGWDLSRAAIEPLAGGITNRNYRLDIGAGSYVLRVGSRGAEKLGISRRREYRCSLIAARSGIGPEVIGFFPGSRLLITRFVPGRQVSQAKAAQGAFLRRIAASLRRLHDGPSFPGFFSPFEAVRRCHRLARERHVPLPPALNAALAAMGRIEKALAPFPRRPCHNDLLSGNLIDDGRTLSILDWEYAAMGDPFFDLGNFAANQNLSPESCRTLLRAYGGTFDRGWDRLQLYRLASDLRESLWGFAQAGISRLDFNFLAYAGKYLSRFLKKQGEGRP